MTTSPLDRAANAFAVELAQWRTERGLSKKQLASEMGFDPSYVSHVEGRRHGPTEAFAKRAEAVLDAGGAIWLRFTEYDELRRVPRTINSLPPRDPPVPDQWAPAGAGLVVEQEIATLSYLDGAYRCTVKRWLYNAGPEPVTRYPVRMSVDRYPRDPQLSNQYHREHPLTWDELRLSAVGGEAPGERMKWRPIHDRDSFKEVWLLFENDDERFPLYHGQRTTIEYSYWVRHDKWGEWFQRTVRLPTRRIVIRLDFPDALRASVWGVQTSLTAEAPLRTPVVERGDGGRSVFEWATENPPLHGRYKLEWRFRANESPRRDDAGQATRLPSERMAASGIVQRGDEILEKPTRPFHLPEEQELAREVIGRLTTALERISDLHNFVKGVALAAPQVRLSWSATVLRPAGPDSAPMVLLNPRVVGLSTETDEQYEGCLSFFDVRGLVRRPLRIEVEHEQSGGGRVITLFEQGLARLVQHEIDHLEGRLYTARMAPGAELVPLAEYRGGGHPWHY